MMSLKKKRSMKVDLPTQIKYEFKQAEADPDKSFDQDKGQVISRSPKHPFPSENPFVNEKIVKIPIDGTLDLHNFSPKETQSLEQFINACLSETILSGKLYGKGIGTLRSISNRNWQNIQ